MIFDRSHAYWGSISIGICGNQPAVENFAQSEIVASHHYRTVVFILHQHRIPLEILRFLFGENLFETIKPDARISALIGQREEKSSVQLFTIFEKFLRATRKKMIIPCHRGADGDIGIEYFWFCQEDMQGKQATE